jgi:hypothetical protein
VASWARFKFERVLSDQALAPERRGFRDRLVVPLLEEAKGLGIAARQIALWLDAGIDSRDPVSPAVSI